MQKAIYRTFNSIQFLYEQPQRQAALAELDRGSRLALPCLFFAWLGGTPAGQTEFRWHARCSRAACRMLLAPRPCTMNHRPSNVERGTCNVQRATWSVERGPRMVQRNSILDFMCDKYEVQTFLCFFNFYAAFVFVVERIEDAPRP